MMLILMFCIVFGFLMDYEVFLFSWIKEEYDWIGDNTYFVVMGLECIGCIVMVVVALLVVMFLVFVILGVSIIKLFGLGLVLVVLMDVIVIWGLFVLVFMCFVGEVNWWVLALLRCF